MYEKPPRARRLKLTRRGLILLLLIAGLAIADDFSYDDCWWTWTIWECQQCVTDVYNQCYQTAGNAWQTASNRAWSRYGECNDCWNYGSCWLGCIGSFHCAPDDTECNNAESDYCSYMVNHRDDPSTTDSCAWGREVDLDFGWSTYQSSIASCSSNYPGFTACYS